MTHDSQLIERTAIVLFNLGGPDGPQAVKPFLFNLFNDPAIIGAPGLIRWLLAKFISGKRAPIAQQIYARMGGGSPIVPNTQAQAAALEQALGDQVKCFITMRYWHPRASEAIKAINAYKPERLILLPLYPQFSTTTTRSSVQEFWREVQLDNGWLQANKDKLNPQTLSCYPSQSGFIEAQVALIRPMLEEAAKQGKPRLLLSAHGLPEKVIKAGDPYQYQCEQTAQAIVRKLDIPDLDWLNCYQSRVGPLKWIGPSTDDEIHRAGRDKVPVVLAPIAFVSEHSETLVELDIEYRELAHEQGVPGYWRVPTVSSHPAFISGLADLVRCALAGKVACRTCPPEFTTCPCQRSSS